MRTTLTLEDSLISKLKAAARKRNLSFKQMVNETLRKGLEAANVSPKAKPFRVRPMSMGVMPGIDYDKINQFLDAEEVEHFLAKMNRRQ
jgi:hypothetical protein